MQQQQPFESGGPYMTDTFTSEPHTKMSRYDKMDFINETTTISRKTIIEEMVNWMNEDQFSDFYEHFCSNWDICRSHEELNERYGD